MISCLPGEGRVSRSKLTLMSWALLLSFSTTTPSLLLLPRRGLGGRRVVPGGGPQHTCSLSTPPSCNQCISVLFQWWRRCCSSTHWDHRHCFCVIFMLPALCLWYGLCIYSSFRFYSILITTKQLKLFELSRDKTSHKRPPGVRQPYPFGSQDNTFLLLMRAHFLFTYGP